MTTETIARTLGGRRVGGGWIARCPAHDDGKPSLSVRDSHDGKVLVHCHAGCDQAQVIAALRWRGLWAEQVRQRGKSSGSQSLRPPNNEVHDDANRKKTALSIWQATLPAVGTLVEIYLQSRGIRIALPPTIRFHPKLKHPEGDIWPTMVALVTCGIDDEPLAIHRTFLSRDGACKAPVESQKMMLGPCRRGAVRLASFGEMLMVGEGIETCLAAMQATGHPAWAALSTSGLRNLDLPIGVRDVVVLADGDEPGEAAARDCAWKWKHEGRRVRIARPPQGMDFNDMLVGRTRGGRKNAQ